MSIERLNGINLHYRLEGDGEETIVLVNGLADDLESWALQMDDLLEAGYRVLRFDNRGIGKSDGPGGLYTTAMMASDVKALVDHLALSSVHLVGVSMGGMIAQEYAITFPQNLQSLTLACTYAAPGPFCSRMFSMWADLAPKLGVPFVMRDVTLWAFTVSFFDDREEELREFEAEMADLAMTVEAYLAQLNSIQNHDTKDRLRNVSVPTLVLAGEEDILIPVSLSKDICDYLPAARWDTVPGGHGCMWEFPTEFNEAVLRFIGEADRE